MPISETDDKRMIKLTDFKLDYKKSADFSGDKSNSAELGFARKIV